MKNNSRVSPSDTIVEMSDRCLKVNKPSTYNTLRNRRSNSGSVLLGRGEKVRHYNFFIFYIIFQKMFFLHIVSLTQ